METRIARSNQMIDRYTSNYSDSRREADKMYYEYQLQKEQEHQKNLK